MFKRYLAACKQHHLITLIGLFDIHRRFSKCTPPTTDSTRCSCHLSTELSHLPRS